MFFSDTRSSACPTRSSEFEKLQDLKKSVNIEILIDFFGLATEIKKSLNRKI